MADAVGDDDVIFRGIERLAGAEQFAGEGRRQHARSRSTGSVQHQHRLAGRLADGSVVELELAHRFAGMEFEVLREEVIMPIPEGARPDCQAASHARTCPTKASGSRTKLHAFTHGTSCPSRLK